LQRQLELLMMSGVPLETCWAVKEYWNNKYRYKVASCWLFILRNAQKVFPFSANSTHSPAVISQRNYL
jgi:hypothetical protein